MLLSPGFDEYKTAPGTPVETPLVKASHGNNNLNLSITKKYTFNVVDDDDEPSTPLVDLHVNSSSSATGKVFGTPLLSTTSSFESTEALKNEVRNLYLYFHCLFMYIYVEISSICVFSIVTQDLSGPALLHVIL